MPSGNGIDRPMCGTVDTGIREIIACHPEPRALESGIQRREEILGGGWGRGRRERKVSLLQLSPVFTSIFPLFPQKRLILRLAGCNWLISIHVVDCHYD